MSYKAFQNCRFSSLTGCKNNRMGMYVLKSWDQNDVCRSSSESMGLWELASGAFQRMTDHGHVLQTLLQMCLSLAVRPVRLGIALG